MKNHSRREQLFDDRSLQPRRRENSSSRFLIEMGNTASSGNEASTYDAGIPASQHNYYNENEEDYDDPFDGIDTLGYRVLGVQPNSPAASAGLVSFLDFLVGAENKMLLGSGEDLEPGQEYDDVDFPALLGENKGKSIELCKSYMIFCDSDWIRQILLLFFESTLGFTL